MTFFHYEHKGSNSPPNTSLLKATAQQPQARKSSSDPSEKPIYYVKIPVRNSKKEPHLLESQRVQINFFFKSLKSQDYWMKKMTDVAFDIKL